jgi:hypothetical protein
MAVEVQILVGADLSRTLQTYRVRPRADKSAMCTINRHLPESFPKYFVPLHKVAPTRSSWPDGFLVGGDAFFVEDVPHFPGRNWDVDVSYADMG